MPYVDRLIYRWSEFGPAKQLPVMLVNAWVFYGIEGLKTTYLIST